MEQPVDFFPIDSLTIEYLKMTGKDEEHLKIVDNYSKECGFLEMIVKI